MIRTQLLAQFHSVGRGTRNAMGLVLAGGLALCAFGFFELIIGHAYWVGVTDTSAFGLTRHQRSDGARFYLVCGAKLVLGGLLLAWWESSRGL